MLQVSSDFGITRISMARAVGQRTLYRVNAFLVDGLLVDSGCPATSRELLEWARTAPISLVVNTHHHEDHCGGNALLSAELGIPVMASPRAVPIMANFYPLPLYRRLVWGQPASMHASPLPDEVETPCHTFSVIHTPGHAPDHVCLYEATNGWLFSGDLYVAPRVRYLRAKEDAWLILDSLHRLLALRPRLLMCSHAGFVEDAVGALATRIEYWETLAQEARRLRRRGLSLRRITRRLLGTEGSMTYVSGGDFSKLNLIRSLLREPARRPEIEVSTVTVPYAATGHFTSGHFPTSGISLLANTCTYR